MAANGPGGVVQWSFGARAPHCGARSLIALTREEYIHCFIKRTTHLRPVCCSLSYLYYNASGEEELDCGYRLAGWLRAAAITIITYPSTSKHCGSSRLIPDRKSVV